MILVTEKIVSKLEHIGGLNKDRITYKKTTYWLFWFIPLFSTKKIIHVR